MLLMLKVVWRFDGDADEASALVASGTCSTLRQQLGGKGGKIKRLGGGEGA